MLEQLKAELSHSEGEHIKAKEYLNEAIRWFEYISSIEESYGREFDLARRMFILNDVTVNYCTLLNWTAVVWHLEVHVSNEKIAEFISRHFGWPRHICETFMHCIRNPTMHTGRAYIWGEYDKKWPHNRKEHKADLTFTGAFLPDFDCRFRIPQEEASSHDEMREIIFERGFSESPSPTFSEAPEEMQATFFFPAFRKLLQGVVLETFQRVKSLDDAQLAKFEELRLRLSITRMPAPENGG